MDDFNLEKRYAAFFAAVVKVLITVMILAFLYHAFRIVFDPELAAGYAATMLHGNQGVESDFPFKTVIWSVKLLSSSVIISFSFLSILFFRKKEFVYSFITFTIVCIILISAVTGSF